MASLTSYWGGFGIVVCSAGASCFGFIDVFFLLGINVMILGHFGHAHKCEFV
uniref:Transmembrane protein n=1 Tax=Nymphaea colorata TaxID=210225 RepID=A0A5K0ZL16_9MAGN